MSNTSIMSVKDMIDVAFAEPDLNIVNFKLIQSILYILARQLRILGRQVEVDLTPAMKLMQPQSSLSVTEIKINTGGKKRKTDGKSDRSKSSSEKTTSESMKTKDKSSTSSSQQRGPGRAGAAASSKAEGAQTGKKAKKRDSSIPTDDDAESQKEMLLRIIDQRADSHEEPDLEPVPMASTTAFREESILIVQRLHSKTSSTERSRSASRVQGTRLSIVTQDEFQELKGAVRQLQAKFGIPSLSDKGLMQKLREGTSLTEAMSALQLSARLEAAEKMLEKLIDITTQVAASAGVDISAAGTGAVSYGKGAAGSTALTQAASQQHKGKPSQKRAGATIGTVLKGAKDSDSEGSVEMPLPDSGKLVVRTNSNEEDWVTYIDLEKTLKELRKDILEKVNAQSQRNAATADAALKQAKRLGLKLEEALDFGTRMIDLEAEVSEYSQQINEMDTGLSSQMTKYQEQLTQMQHELETGLENMAEALVNVGGDPLAVAEMNGRLTNLQNDLEYTRTIQKELKDNQTQLYLDLDEIYKAIEVLRETKSDREEVEDAFRDKAGLGALNGLVTREQFDAVRGDIDKRIRAAYEKFSSQEVVWQRAIDDFVRELNEKVDHVHVVALRDDIKNHLNQLRSRINALTEIVGEPRAFALAKKLTRDAACLSCKTPANIVMEVPGMEPNLPTIAAKEAVGAAAPSVPMEGGDSRPCYPGMPIPHSRDPRAHFCNRYCGGSHTLLPGAGPTKVPPSMNVTHCERTVDTMVGTDGKAYMVDTQKVPCKQCNVKESVKKDVQAKMPEEAATAPVTGRFNSSGEDSLTDLGFLTPGGAGAGAGSTPPFTVDS